MTGRTVETTIKLGKKESRKDGKIRRGSLSARGIPAAMIRRCEISRPTARFIM